MDHGRGSAVPGVEEAVVLEALSAEQRLEGVERLLPRHRGSQSPGEGREGGEGRGGEGWEGREGREGWEGGREGEREGRDEGGREGERGLDYG